MAWTETTRLQYARGTSRYASDCTDAEWAIVEPMMPPPSRVGRPRKTLLREVWNEPPRVCRRQFRLSHAAVAISWQTVWKLRLKGIHPA